MGSRQAFQSLEENLTTFARPVTVDSLAKP